MTFLESVLSMTLFFIYFACLFTVCYWTFRKGRTALGIIGIFFPILWLIGAVLPPKVGSQAWNEEAARHVVAPVAAPAPVPAPAPGLGTTAPATVPMAETEGSDVSAA